MDGIIKKNTKRNVNLELKVNYALSSWRPNYSPTPEEFKRLSDEMIDWAIKSDAIKVAEFRDHKGISPKVFLQWQEKSQELNEACERATSIIGTRRERYGLEGRYNPGIVMQTMGLYDKSYRSFYKWKQQLNQNNDKNKTQDIKVIIEAAPSSDRVPRIE